MSATQAAICPGGSSELSATGGTVGTGAVTKWYTNEAGTNALASTTVSPTATTTYYVRREGTCGNTAMQSVTVTVNTESTQFTSVSATQAAICPGGSSELSATGGTVGTGAVTKWYTNEAGTNALASTTVSPTATTTYYVRREGTCGNTAMQSVTVTVNTPVALGNFTFKQNGAIVAAPNVKVGTPLTIEIPYTGTLPVTASFTLEGTGATIFINGNAISTANGMLSTTFTFTTAQIGVYALTANISNSCGPISKRYEYVVAFEDGMVTGGGWINSPVVTELECGTCSFMRVGGKANFGFVAKAQKGQTIPTGNTEFQFQAGNLNFKSTAYEWLTVSGTRAQFKGTGSINGVGSYKFMLTAIDDNVSGDRFRIRITDLNDVTVYDNQVNTTDTDGLTSDNTLLGGGSIVIHQLKSTSTKGLVSAGTVAPESFETTKFQNYPNPYNDRTTITFSSVKEESFALEVYDVKGALVRKVDMGVTEAGKTYSYEFESRNMPEGMYFARLITPSGVQTIKMVLKR
ncbi:T9SS type A sorting domain-containing protein [Pontibacter toksunensis]|uniref:T9SS type A sorting domain-containing protein n=1 Tax=Pontibacter toksunensis TaxID=1332631 RepID=A0ABW6BMK7_9BACT